MLSMDNFGTHMEAAPPGIGFGQVSSAHFAWLAAIAALVAAIVLAYRRAERTGRIAMRRAIAAALLVPEPIKLALIAANGVDVTEYLPLEICSFAAYAIACDAIWPDNGFFGDVLLTMFMPAAIMALLVPTVTPLPAINFFTIHQFLFHGLIVAYVLARYASGEIRLAYSSIWKSVLKILAISLPVYAIDLLWGKNFMFLTGSAGNPLLGIIWDVTGGGFVYFLGLSCFVIVVVHLFFLFFKGVEALGRLEARGGE